MRAGGLLPNKALQLTIHSVFQSVRGSVWRRMLALQPTEALWLAAERRPLGRLCFGMYIARARGVCREVLLSVHHNRHRGG
jgi:hypothetical protein